jgi:hypothetical protein
MRGEYAVEFNYWKYMSVSELCLAGCGGSRRFRTDFLQELPTPGTGPHFDSSVPNNLTGLVGKTAYLNCRVKNLGNRTVSTQISFVFRAID